MLRLDELLPYPLFDQIFQSETPQVVEHKGRSKDEDHVFATIFFRQYSKTDVPLGSKNPDRTLASACLLMQPDARE